MARLRLTKAAQDDLIGIRLFSNREFGPGATDSYMRGFNRAFQNLREFPRWGTPLEEFGGQFRSTGHRRHRILYRIEGTEVVVIRILHYARDVKRAMLSD